MKKPVIATPEVTNYILRRFNLHADKKLGQNFLIDEDIVRRIAAAAELAPGEPVLEVGPGIGTLTQALAETGANVTAVELDKRLLPVLEKTLEGYENVRVINADVLELDVNSAMGGKTFKVAANLPYYITTPIIFALLEKKLPLERMVIMVQKEVAERITAAEGSCRAYNGSAGRKRLRRAFGCHAVLHRAGNCLYRAAVKFYSAPKRGQRRCGVQKPHRAAGGNL